MNINSCGQASRAAEQERLARLRAELLRGGRYVKFKGILASIAPSMATVSLVAGLAVAPPVLAADVVVTEPPSNAPVVVTSPGVDNVTVTSTGLITNGNDANHSPIDIQTDVNSGTITVDVHDVTTTAGARGAIFINTDGTGDVNVTSDGDVTGALKGINVTHTGDGNVSVTSTGTITGSADSGVRVIRDGSAAGYNVNVSVNQVTANVGGTGAALDIGNASAGGSITVTATDTVTNTAGHVIRINGVDGNSDGNLGGPLTLDVKDLASGSRASASDVFASGGGDGIQLVGAVGATGTQQPTNITTGNIDVSGTAVNLGYAINRVGGPTTVTTGDITAGGAGVVIESADNSENYAINVTTGNVTTASTGITVNQSGTGSISVEAGDINAGMVASGVNGFQNAGGYGVRLDSDPHGATTAGPGGSDWNVATGNITVTNRSTGDFAGTGIGLGTIQNGGNGNTTVTAGNIQAGTGVVYNRNGTGKVSLTTGDITATTGNGIQYGTNLVRDDLIISTGNITAAGKGITGDTQGSNNLANITTINVGNITSGGDGIDIIHTGRGAATVNVAGTIQAGGIGVNLTNDSATFYSPAPDSQTIITVNNIDTPNNTAINVNSNAVKGTTITTNGAITTSAASTIAGDGMRVIEHEGPLVVNVAQGSTITSFNNTMELTNNGTAGTTINVDGALISTALNGGSDGVIWTWGTPGTSTVNINDGSTVQAADRAGFAMTDNGGDSVITVGAATVTGGFRLGTGADVLTFNGTDMLNTGTLDGGFDDAIDVLNLNAVGNLTRDLDVVGQEIENWRAVNLNGGTADLVGTMTAGTFTLGADASGSPAVLSIGANHVGDTLTIGALTATSGNYAGAGGNLLLDVDASTHTSDRLVVDGDVSGVTGLLLNNMTPTGSASDLQDIEVVDVTGASPDDAFVLAQGPAVLGGRAYMLQQGNSAGANPLNWFLTLQLCPAGGLNETNGATLGCVTDDTLSLDDATVFAGNFEGGGGMDILTVAGGASVSGIVAGGYAGADASALEDDADLITINTTGSVGGVMGNLGNDAIYVVGGSTVAGNVEGNEGSNQIRIGGLGALPGGSTPTLDSVTVNGDVRGGDGAATDGSNQIWVLGGAHVAGDVFGGNGNDTIVLNGATAAIDGAIDGGAGNDTIALMNGAVGGVAGGEGDDRISLDGATVNGLIDGGEGNDTIGLNSGSVADGVDAGNGNDAIVLNGATVSGPISGGAGDDTLSLISGSVAGGVNAGTGADTLNVAGATFALGSTSLDGGAAGEGNTLNLNNVNQTLVTPQSNLVNWDTINANRSSLTVSGADSLTAAQVNLLDSAILARDGFTINGGLSLSSSVIDMQDGVVGDAFKVTGDYTGVGSGSALKLDADFSTNLADTLQVGGAITGVTTLSVNDVTPETAEATGQDVLVATAGNVDVSNFHLAGGSIVNGIWEYGLANGTQPETVVLRGSLNSLGALYSGAAGALADAFGELPTLEERVGQRQWLARDNGGAFEGLWIRVAGDRTTKTPESSAMDYSTRNRTWGVQVGADFALVNNESGLLTVGATGQFKDMDAWIDRAGFADKGRIRADGGGAGINLTWNGAHGEYVDLQGQYNKASATLGTAGMGTTMDDLDVESTSAGLEAGKRFVVSADRKKVLVPQAQVSWNQLRSDAFKDNRGVEVDLGDYETSTARVGLAYEYHANGMNLAGPDKDGEMFYAIVNVVRNLSPRHTAVAQNRALVTRDQATWYELGVGGSVALGKNALVYGQLTLSRASEDADGNNGIGGTVGLRWAF
ncbi:autotransporter outer membrane beta-barrel domain-containing protein [Stenotrophomonas sp.]|uniref:autotransporter outer membrane beta-barrel domain-containing protein n=1 Tax=Stenotrophomonas sp. TaxID=69392 RepID=UPI0028A99B71|nr:autotransporter outer membrane beta-barrel domain-containing protein [Stenotrophomonas sp.]